MAEKIRERTQFDSKQWPDVPEASEAKQSAGDSVASCTDSPANALAVSVLI